MRPILGRLHIVAALLIAMLGAGRGLPGLVRTLSGSPAHVCTCASGGSHASCPVCNGDLLAGRPGKHVSVDSAPCGQDRVGIDAASQPTTLPAALRDICPAVVRMPPPLTVALAVDDVVREPATPPPRLRST
jgi:hypothetical protein